MGQPFWVPAPIDGDLFLQILHGDMVLYTGEQHKSILNWKLNQGKQRYGEQLIGQVIERQVEAEKLKEVFSFASRHFCGIPKIRCTETSLFLKFSSQKPALRLHF